MLPSPRTIGPGALLVLAANNTAVDGVGLGQIRIKNSALYGTGTFTPPTEAFYDPTP
jgi:hypothetical protein